MAIIRRESVMYRVVSGQYQGMRCVIRGVERGGYVGIIDADSRKDEIVQVKKGELAQLEVPGWEDGFPHAYPCDLEEFLKRDRLGDVIRDLHVAQPTLLREGDLLATDEFVVEPPRRGCNSSILINLDRTGWVELAPRLPIALKGNGNFKLPVELAVGDRLATRCVIVKEPDVAEVNWVNIYLDRESCCIDVPACMPLALA